MAYSSRIEMIDLVLKGGAAKYLQEARDAGLSFEKIATRLSEDHQIPATGRTVRRWCEVLKIKRTLPEPEQGSAA